MSTYKLGHSTKSALLSIKNNVDLAFAKGEATVVILLDQPTAFDTIDHDMLLDSLSSWFGVGGVVLDWFKSYLSDRVQCIKIGSILSDAKKLLYGVPQGSVLGPILFSLCTTPLSEVIQNHPVLVSISMQMTHNCMCISHIKMLPWPLISSHTAKMMLRGGSLQIRPNSLCLAQSLSVKSCNFPSQSIYMAILYQQSMQLGTLVSGLIAIFLSLAMS